MDGLRYIAKSPPRKWGGFHPEAVKIAKAALWYLNGPRRKQAQRAAQKGEAWARAVMG